MLLDGGLITVKLGKHVRQSSKLNKFLFTVCQKFKLDVRNPIYIIKLKFLQNTGKYITLYITDLFFLIIDKPNFLYVQTTFLIDFLQVLITKSCYY